MIEFNEPVKNKWKIEYYAYESDQIIASGTYFDFIPRKDECVKVEGRSLLYNVEEVIYDLSTDTIRIMLR